MSDALDAPSPGARANPPVHVAIIMDGNGRWATARGLPRLAGHRRGADAVRTAIEAAIENGVRYLTLFGFSSENWKRASDEVQGLMDLLRHHLRAQFAEIHAQGIRVRMIGERERLPADIVTMIAQVEETTRANTRLDLVIALSYGGRGEIVDAARRVAIDAAAGKLDPSRIDESVFAARLWTAGMPDPDVLIRTSGEQRISNFLLWQCAYAELIFVDALWPDFSKRHFADAVAEFARRERRFGAVSA
jgi:undecaprenyl diphosphate synthase